MLFNYKIFVNGIFETVVVAMTAYDACEQFFTKHGNSNKYRIISLEQITAERIWK